MRISLRVKLILSHTLPVLILVPLFSFLLVANLRTFYFDRLKGDLERGGILLAEMIRADPTLQSDPARLQQVADHVAADTQARVQVIGPDGAVLVSIAADRTARIGTTSRDPAVLDALRGSASQATAEGEVATVAVPIDAGKMGVVRFSLELVDVETTFTRLNLLVGAAMAACTLTMIGVGYAFGSMLSQPLRQFAHDAKLVAGGDYSHRIKATTQDEVGDLVTSFNSMVEQLAEQRAARERLLDDVAHELRRPISALQSAAEVLRDHSLNDPGLRLRLLDGLHWEMGRLGRLTERLAFAARDGHAAEIVRRDSVDVAAVTARVVTLFAPEAARQAIQLTCAVSSDLPLIQADEDALIEILTNILDNALKFTPRDGQVAVVVGTTEEKIQIRVTDTGMGLTAAEQAQLFKRFYRGDATRPRPRGIGLGLAIAYELAQAHGGAIRVTSQVGHGATFQIELPR